MNKDTEQPRVKMVSFRYRAGLAKYENNVKRNNPIIRKTHFTDSIFPIPHYYEAKTSVVYLWEDYKIKISAEATFAAYANDKEKEESIVFDRSDEIMLPIVMKKLKKLAKHAGIDPNNVPEITIHKQIDKREE